ncbi:DUF4377 domain-containing protein [Alcanivorax sp. VBW004]|jgi:hypothetical protein|uniref:DUF4377 domain-containing protein n=2 Tax=unclassified Alcanivorax TaxID=2638842 RepID=UPI00017EE4FD|nr:MULTISPECIES: DUF4377 domain-containing protein [unclassified Alcanivorax]EDX89492.1 hypothetical protein ADG881_1594 [Alcanivorax sp. DG881]MTT51513.1 DUF4377 domain-containing protein [Alcanivorax sp. VBW004]HIL22674.1 DUF4377 domain-containing protein [Alcanivorax sp.]
MMMWKRGTLVLLFLLAGCNEPSPQDKPGQLLYVAPYGSACIGVGVMECLRVKHEADANWELFYNHVEGFTYEEGFQYTLRVKVENVESPPADGSSLRYTLLEVVEKTPVNP